MDAEAEAERGEPAPADRMARAYRSFAMRLDRRPTVPELTAPTLWVRGGSDPLVGDIENSAATPNGRIVTIAAAGHMAVYDQPEELNLLGHKLPE